MAASEYEVSSKCDQIRFMFVFYDAWRKVKVKTEKQLTRLCFLQRLKALSLMHIIKMNEMLDLMYKNVQFHLEISF